MFITKSQSCQQFECWTSGLVSRVEKGFIFKVVLIPMVLELLPIVTGKNVITRIEFSGFTEEAGNDQGKVSNVYAFQWIKKLITKNNKVHVLAY